MDIISARLLAKSPSSTPRILSITARPNEDFIVGRNTFSSGDDTIISRRHARFSIIAGSNQHERLVVCNLSKINGLLVNFTPLPLDQELTLHDGDEIVRS